MADDDVVIPWTAFSKLAVKNEILIARGGNLITQLKLSTHHQSRFRDQKVHTTSIYLFDQNCQLDGSTKYIAGHCTLLCWVTQSRKFDS